MPDEIQHLTPDEIRREHEIAEASRRIEWLSVRDLARRLMVSEARIRRWARKGRIPWHKVSNRVLFVWLQIEPLIPRLWHLIGRPERLMVSLPQAGQG